jgi:hypothetical protein
MALVQRSIWIKVTTTEVAPSVDRSVCSTIPLGRVSRRERLSHLSRPFKRNVLSVDRQAPGGRISFAEAD